MKQLWKILFFNVCALTFLFGQTGCSSSLYKVVKSEIPPAPGKGNITGTVLSETDGKPLENVDVLLCHDAIMMAGCTGQIGQTKTDQSGIYWFRNLPPGSYLPAIKKSEQSFYVLQEKKKGEYFPKAVLFNLEAGQTLQIKAQKIDRESQSADQFSIKLNFPINFETIQERKPKLSWEANSQADEYYPFLVKINPASGEQINIELESGILRPVKTTSVAPLKELEGGIYCWGIYVSGKQDNKTNAQKDYKNLSYFVVIGTAQSEK